MPRAVETEPANAPLWGIILLATALATGCAETVRCPDGEVFGESGECVDIPDAGPDGGRGDGGSVDGG